VISIFPFPVNSKPEKEFNKKKKIPAGKAISNYFSIPAPYLLDEKRYQYSHLQLPYFYGIHVPVPSSVILAFT
jgi:hypothetical protein